MKLPKLQYLSTFEVAARLGGFAAASQELNVTPGAVSYQIKALEAQLDTKLFDRLNNGLELTEKGQQLLADVERGLAHIERGLASLRPDGDSGRLVVNVAPSFALFWLTPALNDFLSRHRNVDLQIMAREEPPSLAKGQADIRLVHGKGYFPEFSSKRILSEKITPVCAPTLLARRPIESLADLAFHTLLHDLQIGEDEANLDWNRWLRDEGHDPGDFSRKLGFGNYILVLNAAVAGYGVALGRSALTDRLIRQGKLVCPLQLSRPAERAYYSVVTEAGAVQSRTRLFRNWLHDYAENAERAAAVL